MKHTVNLLIKLGAIFVLMALLLPGYGRSAWTQLLITAVLLTVLSYVAGDLWILPKFGNWAALLAEFGLAALVVWGMAAALPMFTVSGPGIWVTALAVAIAEAVIHWYFLNTKAPGKTES